MEQVLQVEALSGEKINNIVFMGMGEPLANYQNLLQAIEIIRAPWGIGIGARHITVSTSGLGPSDTRTGRSTASDPSGRLSPRGDG